MLTKREIPPFRGSWHYPGGFLLKDEKIEDCFRRIALKEFGVKLDVKKMKFLGIYENLRGDPRGHVIDALHEYRVNRNINLNRNRETGEFRFFKKIPPKMAFNHQATLKKLGYRFERV